MTHPARAAESAFDCLRHSSANTSSQARSEKREATAALLGQIQDRLRRSEYLADLAALAYEQGDNSSAEKYRRSAESVLTNDFALAFRCRAMATSATPDRLFDVSAGIPKNTDLVASDQITAITIAYSQVARAAVRTNNQQALWRSQLLAEAQQLDVAEYMEANPNTRCLLALVDVARPRNGSHLGQAVACRRLWGAGCARVARFSRRLGSPAVGTDGHRRAGRGGLGHFRRVPPVVRSRA